MKLLAQKKFVVTTFSLVLRKALATLEDGEERTKPECVKILEDALKELKP